MYTPDTILTLKEQREPDEETGEDFPYNRVQVVGPSPITHPTGSGWEGAQASGVILRALTNFGANLDEPLGKIQALYDVESVPDLTVELHPKIRVIPSTTDAAGPTPEEVFRREAPGDPDAPRRPGAKARSESPLTDPRPKASDGPLGAVKP